MTVRPCEMRSQPWNFCNTFYLDETTTPDTFDKHYSKSLLKSTRLGKHPMIVAAEVGNTVLIRHFHQKDKTVLNLGSTKGWTPLLSAVHTGQLSSVEVLLELRADPNLSTTEQWLGPCFKEQVRKGSTCLLVAAEQAHSLAITKLLLKNGAIAEPAISIFEQPHVDQAEKEIAIEEGLSEFPSRALEAICGYSHDNLLVQEEERRNFDILVDRIECGLSSSHDDRLVKMERARIEIVLGS